MNLQPTPAPIVTAENDDWYRSGDPIPFAGNLYYPAGAAIHFNGDEMVRSGFYHGVPLYSRTTIEPYSVVFVPIGGALMQPYERRRDGELAGTTGSTVPSLPSSPAIATTTTSSSILQAPAPPVLASPVLVDESAPSPAGVRPPVPATTTNTTTVPQTTATAGRVAPPAARPLRIRKNAANAIYVEFNNARWYSAGPAASLDERTLTQVGQLDGFPVYAARAGASTIYVPIASGLDSLAAYSRTRIPNRRRD